jgi:hypothetical protein
MSGRPPSWLVVVAVLLLVVVPIGAVSQSNTHQASAGVPYQTNSGLTVSLGDDREVEAAPFADNQTFRSDGVTISANGSADVTVTDQTFSQGTMQLASIDATSTPVTATRDTLNTEVTVSGGASALIVHNITLDDNATDLELVADSETDITVSGVPEDIGLQAVDSSGDVVMGAVDSDTDNGRADLTVPAGSYSLRLQRGPSELEIRNESAPSEQISISNGTAEVQFFGDSGTVTSRPIDNGTVDFQGLPLDETFIVSVQADGYRSRTIRVPSLVEQRRAYVLPDSADAVQVRFTLDDVTGTYSERSTLFIEKPITTNNSTDYQIIASDQFGVEGVTAYLEDGVRYELRIVSETGETAQLSTFDADTSETVPLQPTAPAVERPDEGAVGYDITYSAESDTISIEYVDPTNSTDELTVSVVSADGETVIKPNQTYTGADALSLSVATDGDLNETYYVNVEGSRNNGADTIDIREPVGPNRAPINVPMPDQVWIQVVGAFGILLVGGVFSQLNRGVGAVVTSLFGGVLWFFGFMSGLASGAAVALAIGIATLNLFRPR